MVSTLTLSLCVLFKQGQATKPVPVSTSQVQVTIFAPPAPAHLKREASIDESKMRKNNLDSEASLQYHKILTRPIIAATTYGLLPAIYSTTQVSIGLLTL